MLQRIPEQFRVRQTFSDNFENTLCGHTYTYTEILLLKKWEQLRITMMTSGSVDAYAQTVLTHSLSQLSHCKLHRRSTVLFAVGSRRSALRAARLSSAATSWCVLATSSFTSTASAAPSASDASTPATSSLWRPATGSAAGPTSTLTSLPPESTTSRPRGNATRRRTRPTTTSRRRRRRLASGSGTTTTRATRNLQSTTSQVSYKWFSVYPLNLNYMYIFLVC